MCVWEILIIELIILHMMAETMKTFSEVVKSRTISLRVNSSTLIRKTVPSL